MGERLLAPALVTSLVRKVGGVGVMPETLLPNLEALVEEAARLATAATEDEEGRLAADTVALALTLAHTKWDLAKERTRSWEARRQQAPASSCARPPATEVQAGPGTTSEPASPTFLGERVELDGEPVVHLHRQAGEVWVPAAEVSALVARWRGRDLLERRLAALGVAAVAGGLVRLAEVPAILELVAPDAQVAAVERLVARSKFVI